MKVALLITGFFRGCEIDNIVENVLTSDTDVFIHLSKQEYSEDRYINHNDQKSIERLNPKIVIREDEINVKHESKKAINTIRQWYKVYRLFNEFLKYSELNSIKYDVCIKMRYDMFLEEKLNYSFDLSNKIYIPKHTCIDRTKLDNPDDPYVNDIFALGTFENIKKYCSLYENIQQYLQKSYSSETSLYRHLTEQNINYELFDLKFKLLLSQCNLIAICGDSGSGKTELSKIIKNIFIEGLILECDRYHRWERTDENWKNTTHLDPNANHIIKMREDFFDLKLGRNIYQVDYDHKTGKFTPQQKIEPKENIIVCGLHTIYGNKNLIDLKIFIDTEECIKEYWKIQRDVFERGYSYEEVVSKIEKRRPDYERYILPQKEFADIVIRIFREDPSKELLRDNIAFEIIFQNYPSEKFYKAINSDRAVFKFERYEDIIKIIFQTI